MNPWLVWYGGTPYSMRPGLMCVNALSDEICMGALLTEAWVDVV